jgi:hypothetical protein
MKYLLALTLLLSLPVCYADESDGKVCLHIPERGSEQVLIQNKCKKGDIIQVNRRLVAYLCDFHSAIINGDTHEQFICSFLGGKRELREGTNM